MENSVNWNSIISDSKKNNDPIDSVIDAFNSVISTNSDALLSTSWQSFDKNKDVPKTKSGEVASKPTWGESLGTTNNQDESGNSWDSWGNDNSRGNGSSWNNNSSNSGWGNDDNQNYPTNNINSAYTDDRRNYQDVKDTSTNSYTDNSERYHESIDAREVNNVDMHTNNINNFSNNRQDYDNGWSQPPQPQQQQQQQQQQQSYYESQESLSPYESDASTDQNSEPLDPDDIKTKLSAWHSLADPNAKQRDDGIGGGQLHRRGRNFIPVDEATVLAIQQKGGNYRRGGKKGFEKPISRTRYPPTKLPPKPVSPSTKQINNSNNPLKPPAVQKVSNVNIPPKKTPQTPPNRTQEQTQQALKKSSPPPSQNTSQRQPSQDSSLSSQRQPSQDSSLSSQRQPSQDSSLSSQPQRSQQFQQFQQPQQSWTPQLVTEPFWETTSSPSPSPPPNQHPSPKKHANEAISNQSQPIRHQSPARSPRPAKPVQDYNLPYIPPEFDSTPYRKQPSPSPVRDKPRYKQNNNVEERNDYYEDSDLERRENKFNGHTLRHNEPGEEQASRIDRYDRGQLLLTINVELTEGKTQAIEVHVNDDPEDLAKDFCDLWKVTNPVVMPALECLIKEEKEKRLGIN